MAKLTEKQEKILSIIRDDGGWVGPTVVGTALGYDYNSASSKCNGTIKSLVKKGLLERGKKRPNVGKYRYTSKDYK